MVDLTRIVDDLALLIREAREKELWFFCRYQDLWLTPSELERKNAVGLYVWGPDNWILRSPTDAWQAAEDQVKVAIKKRDQIKVMIDAWKVGCEVDK